MHAARKSKRREIRAPLVYYAGGGGGGSQNCSRFRGGIRFIVRVTIGRARELCRGKPRKAVKNEDAAR